MAHARALVAADPRLFGRGKRRAFEPVASAAGRLSDDARLFATTFVAGFLFVSIVIA